LGACVARVLSLPPVGGCNIHPSAYGHSVLAAAIEEVIAHDGQ